MEGEGVAAAQPEAEADRETACRHLVAVRHEHRDRVGQFSKHPEMPGLRLSEQSWFPPRQHWKPLAETLLFLVGGPVGGQHRIGNPVGELRYLMVHLWAPRGPVRRASGRFLTDNQGRVCLG